jgi:hypothetical protein
MNFKFFYDRMFKKTMKIAAFAYFAWKCVSAVPHYSSIIFLTIPGVICIAYTYCAVKTAFLFVLLFLLQDLLKCTMQHDKYCTRILYLVGER